MKYVKSSTKLGKSIIERYNRLDGYYLSDLYGRWSTAKENAYRYCMCEFQEDETSSDFRVGSANTFGFSAGWKCEHNGCQAIRLETKDNSYIVDIVD